MANIPAFKYAPMFQLGEDKTEYRLLTKEGVTLSEFEGKEIVKVSPEALTLLAQQAFHDVEFMLRREHNLQVAAILDDPEASENDTGLFAPSDTALIADVADIKTGFELLWESEGKTVTHRAWRKL